MQHCQSKLKLNIVQDEDIVHKLFQLKYVQNIFIQKVKLYQINQIHVQAIQKLLHINLMVLNNQYILKRVVKEQLLQIMLQKLCKEQFVLLNEKNTIEKHLNNYRHEELRLKKKKRFQF